MIGKELFFSARQCGKTQMMINWFEEMQKHINNKDDFISFIEKFDKVLADKIRKTQEQIDE